MALNDLVCRHAKPTEKTYRLTDYAGLFLEVRPSGHKSWRMRYMFLDREKSLSFGEYPYVTLSDARKAREDARALIKNGIDPGIVKQESKRLAKFNNAQTFELIAKEWHTLNYDGWKENHAKLVWRRLEIHVLPFIGNYPATQLTPNHLLLCLQRTEKTAPEIARKVLQTCRKVTQYAHITGRMDKDITFGLSGVLKKYKKGHYKSIEIDEFPELLRAINSNNGRAYKQTTLALKLLMLTAVRTKELIQAQWPEINFEKAVWTVPPERMKTGLVHIVPLSRQALEILTELKEMNGHRQFVFPSLHFPRKPMSNCTILNSLKRMGYRQKMTGHGFRSLFMGVAKEKLGYKHDEVDRQLAHVRKNSVDRAYDRATFLPQRTKLMQDYADYIDGISNTILTRRKNAETGNSFNQLSYQSYTFTLPEDKSGSTHGYIGMGQASFIQTDQKGLIPEAAQRRGQQSQLLVDRGHTRVH